MNYNSTTAAGALYLGGFQFERHSGGFYLGFLSIPQGLTVGRNHSVVADCGLPELNLSELRMKIAV
jgi:hypothetical protein